MPHGIACVATLDATHGTITCARHRLFACPPRVIDRSDGFRREVLPLVPEAVALARFRHAFMQRLRSTGGLTTGSWIDLLARTVEPSDLRAYLSLRLPMLDALSYRMEQA